MTDSVLGVSELTATLRDALTRIDDRSVIAFRAAPTWQGPESITIDGKPFAIAACPSALAVRERLAQARPSDPRLVILSDCDEDALGADVLARIARHRLLRPDRWAATMQLFGARNLDPALVRSPWLADALLAASPTDGYARVASGMLDEETAWHAFSTTRLGLTDRRPGLGALLMWSRQAAAGASLAGLDDTARDALFRWWRRTAGAVMGLFEALVRSGRLTDALPLGVVLPVVYSAWDHDALPRQAVAKDRLTRFLGDDASLEEAAVVRFGAEAERQVRRLWSRDGLGAVRSMLDRAAAILAELGAETEAFRSELLLLGFDQRRARAGAAIGAALKQDSGLDHQTVNSIEELGDAVLEHQCVVRGDADSEPVEMAVRLVRWLATDPVAESTSFGESVVTYGAAGAFVDRARDALRRGGEAPAVWNQAMRRLVAAASVRRVAENHAFATGLQEWIAVPDELHPAVMPIEETLDRVVAPLAATHPVLLLVVDGMSLAVHEELSDDLEQLGYRELRDESAGRRRLAVGALPTVTEVCRTSLLCGRLASGNDDTESKGFTTHPSLRAASASSHPPRLFHKRALVGDGGVGLAEEVRVEVAARTRRVIGVVLNAVDDHLLKGDQVRARWTVASIKPLRALLGAAREGNRVVILASDHGHVLHNDVTFRRADEGGERFRRGTGQIEEGEVLLRGSRVIADGSNAIIVPYVEDLCYGAKRNGYHGGATPQEAVVPISVWSASDLEFEGWREAAPARPAWWYAGGAVVAAPTNTAVPADRPRRPKKSSEPQRTLFDVEAPVSASGLIDQLFASKTYAEQRKLAGRAAVPEERVRAILQSLIDHGGKLLRPAMARVVDMPAMRLHGALTQLRKVLNVDGYDVLTIDVESDTVALDEALMVVQFELKGR